MTDDIVALLTQEVKEDLIENYLYERRLVEEQIKHVTELATETARSEDRLYKQFARIYELLMEPAFIERFVKLLGLAETPFSKRFAQGFENHQGLGRIKVLHLTQKGKCRRLLVEAYRRLYRHNREYTDAYGSLEAEAEAVNRNLKKFEDGYDLLTILSFLKGLDVEGAERRHWLGDNFTPKELASVEGTLRFRAVRMEQFELTRPVDLPEPNVIEDELRQIATIAFEACGAKIKRIMA